MSHYLPILKIEKILVEVRNYIGTFRINSPFTESESFELCGMEAVSFKSYLIERTATASRQLFDIFENLNV